MLQVRNLSKSFGGLAALKKFSLDVERGQIVGLIGPNGAGKTTAFNLISGTLSPTSGSVRFKDHDITGGPPSKVVRLGLARTFQNTSIYPGATVAANVHRGTLSRLRTGLPDQLRNGRATRDALLTLHEEAEELLELVGLASRRDTLAAERPYGLQKRLGVAVGLATRPELLLLDEPAAGLNAEEAADFGRLLRALRERMGLTMLLVEHHMALVMELCERIVVLVQGEKIAEDTPARVRGNPQVVEAYLGAPEPEDA